MYYEINVSRNGRHLFATHERSLTDYDAAVALAREFQRGLDDVEITLNRYETTGKSLNWMAPLPAREDS